MCATDLSWLADGPILVHEENAVTVDDGQIKAFAQGILDKQLPTYYANQSLPTYLDICQEEVSAGVARLRPSLDAP